MIEDVDGVLDRRLVGLLAFLTERGDSTVLGEPSRSRAGIERVSRRSFGAARLHPVAKRLAI